MFKKGLFSFVCFLFIFPQTMYAKSDMVTVNIDGCAIKLVDVSAEIIDGEVFVPLRLIAEALGEAVYWDANAKTVTVTYDGFSLYGNTIKIGDDYATNIGTNEKVSIGHPFYIKNNRTMVNQKFFSKVMLKRVYWDEDNKVLDIYTCPGTDPNYRGTPVDIWVAE